MNNKDNNPHRYDDMLYMPHHQSMTRPHMSMKDRAAQFSPFAALTGHDAAIKETARITDRKMELDEDAKAVLNEKLQFIRENLERHPIVSITYFEPDVKKAGGAYITLTGTVKRIDEILREVIFTDRQTVHIDDISSIGGSLFFP